MSDEESTAEIEWPSIDDHHPLEEGGPTARAGLSYQDEIVVDIFLDMIEDATIQKVHCETHDDILIKRVRDGEEFVEYVQVKSNEPDTLWSVASLCAKGADSVCAKSLTRDQHKETARFRIVTLRDVNSELRLLTYPCYGPGRETTCAEFGSLSESIKGKLPDLTSEKGSDIEYWLALAGKLSFASLVERMRAVKKEFGSKSGSTLKKLIYNLFDEEVGNGSSVG
ncbi:dsDNA nuclease domain-containing protein [Bradyrhizobium sp. LLZ17]|uniref:DsDNA nuclease domain-containing protein n=1 Tax=Bradyrhizobium sp. LLZ17 TaxID=3239388 RepID=A0AB39XSY7_9BRAD